MLHKYLIQIS